MKTSYQVMLFSLLMALTLGFCRTAAAAPKVVWQIGKFNESPSEFNTGKQGPPLFGSRYPQGELIYTVGRAVLTQIGLHIRRVRLSPRPEATLIRILFNLICLKLPRAPIR